MGECGNGGEYEIQKQKRRVTKHCEMIENYDTARKSLKGKEAFSPKVTKVIRS